MTTPEIDASPATARVEVRVQYVADCPHWPLAETRLRDALRQIGRADVDVRRECVSSEDQALRLVFRGSPTVLVNGRDPFADTAGVVGLSCRRYRTEHGIEG